MDDLFAIGHNNGLIADFKLIGICTRIYGIVKITVASVQEFIGRQIFPRFLYKNLLVGKFFRGICTRIYWSANFSEASVHEFIGRQIFPRHLYKNLWHCKFFPRHPYKNLSVGKFFRDICTRIYRLANFSKASVQEFMAS